MNSQFPPEAAVAPHDLDLVRRRLSVAVELQPDDIAQLGKACVSTSSWPAGTDLTDEPGPLFLTAGWACRIRDLGPYGRQVLGFVLPGDPIGSRDRSPAPHRTVALTRISTLDARALGRRMQDEPEAHLSLTSALASAEREEHHRHLDHAVRLGALSAYRAMLHFLAELHDRLERVGLAREGRFALPVAQDVLGDALGISEVHANRILAQLRRDGLLELGPGWALLVDRT
jgi:CRP-like cAMP-binding protein